MTTETLSLLLVTTIDTNHHDDLDPDHHDDLHDSDSDHAHDHEHEHEDEALTDTLVSAASLIIALAIFAGNLATLISVSRCRRLQTIPNLYVCSLAVADLLVGLVIFIQGASSFPDTGDLLQEKKYFCLFLMSLLFTCIAASMLSSALVAIDRFVYIHYAFRYEALVTKERSLIIIIVTWCVALTYGTVPLYWNKFDRSEGCTPTHIFSYEYMIIIHPTAFISLAILTFALYLKIAKVALAQRKRVFIQAISVQEQPSIISTNTTIENGNRHSIVSHCGVGNHEDKYQTLQQQLQQQQRSQQQHQHETPQQLNHEGRDDKKPLSANSILLRAPDNIDDPQSNSFPPQELQSFNKPNDVPRRQPPLDSNFSNNSQLPLQQNQGHRQGRQTTPQRQILQHSQQNSRSSYIQAPRLSVKGNPVSRSTWRMVKTLALLSGMFFLCWTPLFVMAVLEYTIHVSHLALSLTGLLGVINSGVNCLVLVSINKHFRREFANVFCCWSVRKEGANNSSADTSSV